MLNQSRRCVVVAAGGLNFTSPSSLPTHSATGMLKVIGASWFQTRVSTCIVGAVSALGILAIILGEIDR